MRTNGFDRVALFYDVLAKAVFGSSIRESQFFYLDRIPEGASVLILGGGTGWLAKRLLQINVSCTIVYQEASERMLELSRDQMSEEELRRIQFVHASEISSNETFDVVITNFFLDLFHPTSLNEVISKIKRSLDPRGIWLVTDFVDEGRWWQKFLLNTMYLFFRITSKIEATSLPSWEDILTKNAMTVVDSKGFYNGFIKTEIVKLT